MDMAMKYSLPVAAGKRQSLGPGGTYFAVTFDDALQSVAENALPELQRRGIPSTIFVVTRSLDQFPIWMDSSCHNLGSDKVMSLKTLKESMSDLVEIGSHSLTHPYLPRLEEREARRQISESRSELESLLNTRVTLFSFPYGAFNEKTISYCREAGYLRVFTSMPRTALSNPEEFACGRIEVTPADWPMEFFLKIQGAYSWLPAAFSLKRKIKSSFRSRRPGKFSEELEKRPHTSLNGR
jgi:peptidoglycan/xylan/chitin deacetylase (PgdA/CDA1 family)